MRVVLAYFAGLDLPLVVPMNRAYAQVAREMFDRGDWITPTLGVHTWFEKPSLLYWFQITPITYSALVNSLPDLDPP